MKNLVGLCLLLAAFIAVNAEDIPQDPVNIADEVEEDRDAIDDEDKEDRDDIDEEDEDKEDEEDRNELIDMNVEDRRIPEVEECGIRCDAMAIGPRIHTGSLRINTPRQCQKHCEKWNIDHPDRPQCQFFRWRGQDLKAKWRKRRRCYLLTKVTDVKKRRGWCWGPSECIDKPVEWSPMLAKVWDLPNQCPFPGQHQPTTLEACKLTCEGTPGCTAIVYDSVVGCFTLECLRPIPIPNTSVGDFRGYYILP